MSRKMKIFLLLRSEILSNVKFFHVLVSRIFDTIINTVQTSPFWIGPLRWNRWYVSGADPSPLFERIACDETAYNSILSNPLTLPAPRSAPIVATDVVSQHWKPLCIIFKLAPRNASSLFPIFLALIFANTRSIQNYTYAGKSHFFLFFFLSPSPFFSRGKKNIREIIPSRNKIQFYIP